MGERGARNRNCEVLGGGTSSDQDITRKGAGGLPRRRRGPEKHLLQQSKNPGKQWFERTENHEKGGSLGGELQWRKTKGSSPWIAPQRHPGTKCGNWGGGEKMVMGASKKLVEQLREEPDAGLPGARVGSGKKSRTLKEGLPQSEQRKKKGKEINEACF